jgi:SH3-like domain-containing protein
MYEIFRLKFVAWCQKIPGAIAVLLLVATITIQGAGPAFSLETGASGLPLPRYVSLKSERVNMRIGPGRAYQVQWTYLKRGLPMEIIQEYDNWRKVRDAEGNEGWILHSLLSGERTALVAPWNQAGKWVKMHPAPDDDSRPSARIEPGVMGSVKNCSNGWCILEAGGISGYVQQKLLWGVYPDERF